MYDNPNTPTYLWTIQHSKDYEAIVGFSWDIIHVLCWIAEARTIGLERKYHKKRKHRIRLDNPVKSGFKVHGLEAYTRQLGKILGTWKEK